MTFTLVDAVSRYCPSCGAMAFAFEKGAKPTIACRECFCVTVLDAEFAGCSDALVTVALARMIAATTTEERQFFARKLGMDEDFVASLPPVPVPVN